MKIDHPLSIMHAYLNSSFRIAGLKPASGDSYLQTFKVISFKPNLQKNILALERKGKKTLWKKPDISTSYHSNLDLSAAAIFAGYGITAPEMEYDDYRNIDAKGKFVLVFEHEPQETNPTSIFNGTGNTQYATTRIKALNAQSHGAVGLLVAPEPNRKHPSTQQRLRRITGE